MMRTSWKGALLAVVASAGVAWGEPVLLAPGKTSPTERTVSIQQKDCLPESCRLLKTWKTADGPTANLLRTLDTDEMLTAVQKEGTKGNSNQVGVRIYRWGNRTVAPEGAPIPPADPIAIRQTTFTTEQPTPHRAGELPHLTKVSASVDLPPAPPLSCVPNYTPSCSSGACDKSHCDYVHHYETVPSIRFVPGECVPVCPPTHAPNFGYFQTQWHPFGAAQGAPLTSRDNPSQPVASSKPQ
jgi:hypothetical protein